MCIFHGLYLHAHMIYTQRESDQASKDRLKIARHAISEVDEKLRPLKAQYENEKKRGDEITEVRRRIDELKAKADEAERRYSEFFSSKHVKRD